MPQVRYIGPHTEPVEVGAIGYPEAFEVIPGEPVDLPDWLVHGVPAREDDNGLDGLLSQPSNWELVDAPPAAVPEPQAAPAPEGAQP